MGRYLKIHVIPPLRLYGHAERMQNQKMTKQIAKAAVEGRRKTERQRTRWREELENNFNKIEINKRQEVVRDHSGKE
jgi:hypothetical protein